MSVTPPSLHTLCEGKSEDRDFLGIIEYPLFTDVCHKKSQISNEGLPFKVSTTDEKNEDNLVLHRLTLCLEAYQKKVEPTNPSLGRTLPTEEISFDFFIEDNTADQIAVLLSLVLGIRVKSGMLLRGFDKNGEEKLPLDPMLYNNPPPVKLIKNDIMVVLPTAIRDVYGDNRGFSLDKAEPYLSCFYKLTVSQAEALIRAAKLYRDALWLVESTPELSWIMLVSAIEVVAKDEIKNTVTPEEELERIEPKLAKDIKLCGDSTLLSRIAKRFTSEESISKKYREFLIKFLPESPPKRLPGRQINWDDLKLTTNKNPLSIIYNYRSKALHAGNSFPPTMSWIFRSAEGIPYDLAETPTEYNMFLDGKIVKRKPEVMMLSIFEYIVRNALLKWWKSCIKK
jgi:hypothetical protein